MKPSDSIARFVERPAGHYLVRRNYVVWCPSRALFGTSFWGVLTSDEAQELCRVWELDRAFERYDTVVDASRLTSVDLPGFGIVAEYLKTRLGDYQRRVRRQIVLSPRDEVNGALVAGLGGFLGFHHDWRSFSERHDAIGWLDNPETAPAFAEMDEVIAEVQVAGELIPRVRELLKQTPTLDLATLSRQLNRSMRSMQRQLELAGSSFRDESRQARAAVAAELLRTSDLKLEAVARQVGYSSLSHFNQMFREVTGVSPVDYRAGRTG